MFSRYGCWYMKNNDELQILNVYFETKVLWVLRIQQKFFFWEFLLVTVVWAKRLFESSCNTEQEFELREFLLTVAWECLLNMISSLNKRMLS